ncbi:MAG: tRNA (guanosine(37)-N1)-methyltransferase TrmD [Bacteroidota bacterium]|jgi:tRNA (guanine37-N1)-methyltransferase|nr:tRNA (guanosine(37)-N1)-methyltransferase TrmD [Bacteroidota bacterium]
MRIDVITAFPPLLQGPLSESILKRAQDAGHAEITVHDLRAHAHDKHRTLDDTPYGGGAGMILKPEPLFECVESLQAQRHYDEVILTTPAGTVYNQGLCKRLSMMENLIIICGHYKGVDQRVIDALVTMEISIGDYVLTGGELAAAVIIDSVVRLIPGVIGDGESMLTDSFMEGELDCPYYTRPPEFRGMPVPADLMSGDHKRVAAWRARAARVLTTERRPDLLDGDEELPDRDRRKRK